ncbi:hypothetical protein LCGC14_0849450 [marine sediment metagenome]|uniref:Uncharacterized protein n=1 Tax=marine sediment metagenome TaxID=412755 RepID=A0A0F9PVZ6_9ZZZZ
MSFSDWFENTLLNHIFSKGNYSPQMIYTGLCTNLPADSSTGGNCNEVANAYGYSRIQTSSAYWNTAVSGQLTNALEIAFPIALGTWGVIRAFVLLNSGSYGLGNVLIWGDISPDRTIVVNYQAKFPPGSLVVVLD